jgi:hypothetical protein
MRDAMTAQSPVAQVALSDTSGASTAGEITSDGSLNSLSSPDGRDQANGQQTPVSGQVLLNKGQTYVAATHWAAILEDVRTLTISILIY